jgi:acetoin utilization deacetylase AcuC-like enzyme
MSGATYLAADVTSKEHDPGPGHPERVERFDAACGGVADLGLARLAARRATFDEIALVHHRRYIRTAEDEIAHGFHELSGGDTHVSHRSYDAALHAAGAVMNAVDSVVAGEARNAFCIVRPPGHHATPDRGMGFCVFNNVAVAARYAQKKHGIERVLIVDWDVHHGNGTQDIFYADGSVFFFSTHQSPWYPGTGAADETGYAKGEGKTLNCPFAAGAGREEIVGAFENRLLPALVEFRPDLVLVSAGFDSRAGDPLGHFQLSDQDFADLTRLMMEVADQSAGGRLVSVLEGGYNLTGLSAAVRSHVQALML